MLETDPSSAGFVLLASREVVRYPAVQERVEDRPDGSDCWQWGEERMGGNTREGATALISFVCTCVWVSSACASTRAPEPRQSGQFLP